MWPYCGHFQLQRPFRPLDQTENCFIQFTIENWEDCHFKFQNRSWDPKHTREIPMKIHTAPPDSVTDWPTMLSRLWAHSQSHRNARILFIYFCCLFLTTSLIICHVNLSVRSRMTTYHTHAFDHLQRFSIKSQNHICTQRLTYQNEASYDDPFMNLDDIFLLQWYCCLRKGWWFCLFYKEPCAAIAVHRRIYNCCGGSWPKYKTSQEQVSLSHAIYKNT